MRCHQYIGLSPAGKKFADEELHIVGVRNIPAGWFEEEIALNLYKDDGGNRYEEFLQTQPWSSGPMSFLAIKRLMDGTIFGAWTDDEIEGMI